MMIRFTRTSMTCSAGSDAASVEARVLPMVAVSVPVAASEPEGGWGVRPSVAVSVVAAVPAGAVGDEDEGSPWLGARGVEGMTVASSGPGAVWFSGRAERERLRFIVVGWGGVAMV